MNEEFFNIWEIDPGFKCPVVGAMLSVEKHAGILKKCGYNIKELKPYEYHQIIMCKLVDENSVSIKVNNYIRHHAVKYMKKIAEMDNDEIFRYWKDIFKNGNSGPLMYAISAKKDSEPELLHEVYGDTHMLSHANMTEVFNVRKKLYAAEEKIVSERKKLGEKTEEIKRVVLKNRRYEKELAEIKNENIELKRGLRANENSSEMEEEIQGQKIEILELKERLKAYEEELSAVEREKKSLEIDFLSLKNENRFLKEEMEGFISNFKSAIATVEEEQCEGPSCPQYQLCAKRICMVGGMTKMKSMYKKIVENAGGEFFYDDGYFRNKNSNLEAFVKKSDVILCPVNCNSHNACLKVKKLCNRYNKKIKFLNSSSLTSVTQAIFETEDNIAN